jgi:hypothetical protein
MRIMRVSYVPKAPPPLSKNAAINLARRCGAVSHAALAQLPGSATSLCIIAAQQNCTSNGPRRPTTALDCPISTDGLVFVFVFIIDFVCIIDEPLI